MFKTVSNKQNSTVIFDQHMAELGQAKTRLFNVPIAIAYTHFSGILWNLPATARNILVLYMAGFALFTVFSFLNILYHPGNYPIRRLTNMAGDYGSLAIVMILGQTTAMPLYALILWVTLGNGMRFGQRYLLIAAIMAQLALLALILASAYWRSQFELMVTFSVTAIALPTYAMMLLRETAKARDTAQVATLAKSRFLAQASHDLRQPIHAAGYYIGALRGSPMNADQTNLVNRIEQTLGGVARLFKSLLDIAKLDSGTIDVRAEPVALKPLIDEIILNNE